MSDNEYGRKRKSDREDDYDTEEEIFKRSKKVGRSPPKTSGRMGDNIEKMMKMMEKMGDKMEEMNREIKKTREEQREYREEMKQLRKENQKLMEENGKMKKIITELDNRLERLENGRRKNNIVVQGVRIETNNPEVLQNTIGNFLEKELQIETVVESAVRLGERTCLVGLANQEEKRKVMLNKQKLRFKTGERVYIQEDMSKKDREIQKKIRMRAKEERDKGKTVKIGFRKIFIETEEWRWNAQDEKLEKIKQNIMTKNQ